MGKIIQPGEKLFLDTMLFIYHIEEHPRYSIVTESIFKNIERGQNTAITSTTSLLEILVQPKKYNRYDAASEYYNLLQTFPNLEFIPVDVPVADAASSVRAEYNLRTPDAIQIATALYKKANLFLTNDRSFLKIKEIKVVLLDDIL